MKKRQSYLIILLVLILCAGISVSLAFLVRNIQTENIVTFGHIRMELIETELCEDGIERAVNLDESINLTRQETLDRRLKVKNVGEHSAYIRLKLDFSLAEDADETEVQEYLSFAHDEDNWVKDGEWYYYQKPLHPDETTSNLMTELHFDSEALSTYYAGKKLKLDVKAQAVQVKNNETEILKVEGWPEESK